MPQWCIMAIYLQANRGIYATLQSLSPTIRSILTHNSDSCGAPEAYCPRGSRGKYFLGNRGHLFAKYQGYIFQGNSCSMCTIQILSLNLRYFLFIISIVSSCSYHLWLCEALYMLNCCMFCRDRSVLWCPSFHHADHKKHSHRSSDGVPGWLGLPTWLARILVNNNCSFLPPPYFSFNYVVCCQILSPTRFSLNMIEFM